LDQHKNRELQQRKAQHRARLLATKKLAAKKIEAEEKDHPPSVNIQRWRLWWARLCKFVLFPLSFLPFLAVYEIYFATIPEVAAPDNSSPFILPYTVKNNSHIFDMRDATVNCDVPSFGVKKLDSNNALVGWQILPGVGKSTIGAGRNDHFQCPISVDKNLEVIHAIVDIQVSYKTLWWDRMPYKAHFKWFADATPPRWMEFNEKSGTESPNMIPPFPRKE
jgi:hypothetical protein